MKHFVRDSIIFLIHYCGISLLYCGYMRRTGPLVRIIAFHDVVDRKWFEEVIQMLNKNYAVLTPEQFHQEDFNAEKINILITFDDGYQSWIDNCVPVLEQYKIKALFFINSGLLNVAYDGEAVEKYVHHMLQLSPKDPLTWEGAKQLVVGRHSIGGHTVNHFSLATLEQNDLEREVIEDKKNIETRLGVTLTDFAYPFGRKKHWNSSVLEQVQKAGYTHVYTADTGFFMNANKGEIPRTLIEKNQPPKSIKRWIHGGYDVFNTVT